MLSKYTIKPILLSTYVVAKSLILYRVHSKKTVNMGGYIWYIQGASGNVLVDSGPDVEMFRARGFPIEPVQTREEGLGKLGLRPEDIDTIILTHSHHDHASGLHRFPNARVIVQQAEIDFLRNPHPYFAPEGYTEMLEGLRLEVVKGDIELQKGLKILHTPGHTPGTQSIAVETEKGTAVIAGFCCIEENFDPPEEVKKIWPMVPPTIHTNVMEIYDSMVRIKKMADIIVPVHAEHLGNTASIPA